MYAVWLVADVKVGSDGTLRVALGTEPCAVLRGGTHVPTARCLREVDQVPMDIPIAMVAAQPGTDLPA